MEALHTDMSGGQVRARVSGMEMQVYAPSCVGALAPFI